MTARELSRQDVEDILYGATLFGAGGGGELSEGFGLLDEVTTAGKPLRMIALEDVPDDALICTPYLLGAISALPEDEERLYRGLPQADVHPIRLAHRRLVRFLGAPLFGAVPCELGGSNTAVPFYVAAMEGGVVIDADPAGRAVPEITHSSYYLADLPAAPIVAANEFAETIILEGIVDDARAETLVRALSRASRNDIAAIDHALPAGQLRGAINTGTLSRAGHIGRLWRQNRDNPTTLPHKLAAETGGKVAFTGKVVSSNWRTEAGFTLGEFCINAAGQTLRITLKNENMVAWLDDEVRATIPEIISVMDVNTGEIITNPNVTVGRDVSVLVLPAPQMFLTPRGLEIFGPKYVGLNRAFQPFCKTG